MSTQPAGRAWPWLGMMTATVAALVLLADIVLPKGMTGRQVSDAIAARLPGVKTLYMSGYTENAIIHHGRLDEGVVLLSKPFPRSQLAEKLREVLDS